VIGPATTSGEQSATAQIWAQPGFLHGIEINPPQSGLVTLKVYDGASTSGKLLSTLTVAAGENSISVQFNSPRVVNSGIHAALSGTTTYVIAYSP